MTLDSPTNRAARPADQRKASPVTSNPIDPADDLVLEQILNAREHFALYTRGVKQLELRRQLLQQFDKKLRVTIIVRPELIQEIDQLTAELDRLQRVPDHHKRDADPSWPTSDEARKDPRTTQDLSSRTRAPMPGSGPGGRVRARPTLQPSAP
jgi:hypothetical protein